MWWDNVLGSVRLMTADHDWGGLDPKSGAGLAAELWRAEQAGDHVELPSQRVDGLSWVEARAIATAVDDLRRADGCHQIGYKLGWTSEVMRRSLGIERPNWGTLWDHQRFDRTLHIGHLRHPKVEPEIVYRCATTLTGADVTAADVLAAADGWALGHEIVHPRFVDFGFTWLDNTADNSSSQAVAIGEFGHLGSHDPAEVEIEFGDGGELRRGTGAAAMDSPAQAVAWLVRALHDEGLDLPAGHIVFTGGLAAPFDVTAGVTYRLGSTFLPGVDFDVVA
jgi:2-keto-4-pentenoate hydratase